MLNIEQLAPAFSLPDQDGMMHNLSDYHGQMVLVYFYPKDDTPGCTKEACAIADMYNDFERQGVKVFGISADSVESHKKFAEKYNLPFSLLADTNYETIKAYEAFDGDGDSEHNVKIKRVSYLIDGEGKIIKIYPKVDPASHAVEILKDISGATEG